MRVWFLTLSLLVVVVSTSGASVIIDIGQVGSDVVANASGTLNLAGLSAQYQQTRHAQLVPNAGAAFFGPASGTPVLFYYGMTGPTNFGAAGVINASTGSGTLFGVNGTAGALYVLDGYASGSLLSATSSWQNNSLATLSLTPGTHYTWTWGSGVNADSITMNVNAPAAVPEPSTYMLLSMGLGATGFARRKMSKR